MPCEGKGDDHCCYIKGEPCHYLEENTVPGRRWACGLKRIYGDWDLVLDSLEYKTDVAPNWARMGEDYNCRDWPDIPGRFCGQCGNGNPRPMSDETMG